MEFVKVVATLQKTGVTSQDVVYNESSCVWGIRRGCVQYVLRNRCVESDAEVEM